MARSLFWLSDEAWKTLEPHLPHGKPGKPRVAWTIVISGILHVLKTGCRWRDVPPAFGPPTTIYNQSLVPAPYLAAHFRENGGRRSSS